MSDKTNLDLAKLKADDEFYTSFVDIVTELSHWIGKLRVKKLFALVILSQLQMFLLLQLNLTQTSFILML